MKEWKDYLPTREPDNRPRVYVAVMTYGASEGNKVEVFAASFDKEHTIRRANQEAEAMGMWKATAVKPIGADQWYGDEGEFMFIDELPVEGNVLDMLVRVT